MKRIFDIYETQVYDRNRKQEVSVKEEVEMSEEYVQARVPDKTRLAELINQCKGPDRTMNDFCAECGISPATMSRVINGKNVKAVDTDFLKAVWDHRVSDSAILLSDLMEADGYVSNREQQRIKRQEHHEARMREKRLRAYEMKLIITKALFERGVQTQKLGLVSMSEAEKEQAKNSLFAAYQVMDLAIAIKQDNEELQWGMEFYPDVLDDDETSKAAIRYVRRMIQRYALIFLEDAWVPEEMKNIKTSFVFVDPDIYDCFVTYMQPVKDKLNSPFSAILIDMEKQDVAKECILSGPETESLFDKKVIEDNTDSDIDSLDDWNMK